MDRQVGRYQKVERQVIGDRVVLNPRTRLCSPARRRGQRLRHVQVVSRGLRLRVLLRAGGGGLQRFGRLVLQAMRAAAHVGREAIRERPGPPEARSIAGKRVRRGHPGIHRLIHAQRPGGWHGSTTERRRRCTSRQLVSRVKGRRGQGGRIHPAAQAADDSGRGRGAAVRATA